jgi:uncharacterized C2H2 Zn-finger protein
MKLTGDRNQCPGCGLYFRSTHAFEKHRTGEHGVNRRCRSVEEMLQRGMALKNDGFWVGSERDEQSLAGIGRASIAVARGDHGDHESIG